MKKLTCYVVIYEELCHWYDYTFIPFVFIACFVIMQRSLMAMIGFTYKDMFAIAKRRFGK